MMLIGALDAGMTRQICTVGKVVGVAVQEASINEDQPLGDDITQSGRASETILDRKLDDRHGHLREQLSCNPTLHAPRNRPSSQV